MSPRALLVAVFLALHLAAQGSAPPRGRAIGLVDAADGRHVADALVTLWSWPLPGRSDVGEPDRVTVRTRADGRFAAEVLDGRSYSVFAEWTDAAGWHSTAVEDGVMPGSPRVLREASPRPATTIELVGEPAWRRHGPLRLTMVIGAHNPLLVPLDRGAGPRFQIPPMLPPGPAWIDVRTAAGQLVRSAALASAGDQTIRLPAVHSRVVAVVDDAGRPVPDAELHALHDFGYYGVKKGRRVLAPDPIGETGEDGTARITVPAEHPVEGAAQPRVAVLVTARDLQRHSLDLVLEPGENGRRVTARLRVGANLRCRFVDRDGEVVTSGIVPLYESSAQLTSNHPLGGFVPLPPLPMRREPDGSFVGHGLHGSSGVRVFVVVDPARAAALGMDLRPDFALPPVLPIFLGKGSPGHEGLDLGDVDLAALPIARFAVIDHEGAPVSGARLRVADGGTFGTPIDYLADRSGRLQLPLPNGVHRVGAFVVGGGVASRPVSVPDDIRADERIELELTEPRTVRGSVTGIESGRPAGVRLVLTGVRSRRADLDALAYSAVHMSPPAPHGATFTLRVPFGDARYSLRARRGGAAGLFADGDDVTVQVREADVAGLEVPAPRGR